MDSTNRDDSARRRLIIQTIWSVQTDIVEQKALYFPDIAGKSLANGEMVHTTTLCAGHISVISILSTKISEVT